MACGTPVIAYRRGSMPEVVDEGVTGFLVHDVDSAVAAIEKAIALDRSAVSARAAARFGVDRMVDDYLRVYEQILTRRVGVISLRSSSTDAQTTPMRESPIP